MSGATPYSRAPGVIARCIAGETILVPVTRRAQEMGLFTLNEVGTFVWEKLDGQRSVAGLAEAVAEHFEVDRAEAERDVREFVAMLARTGCAEEVRP